MFTVAFLIGVYSYSIFFLGLAGMLYQQILIPFSLFFFLITVILFKKNMLLRKLPRSKKNVFILFILLFLQICINFLGALGPELGFDALWYHVPIPKLYVLHHSIYHIPFPLFYYSDMPKLLEMLYIPVLSFGADGLTKLIHFSFSLLCCLALYKLSRKFVSPVLSLLCVIIFYSNLVVGWESITAYIDLGRTFFEIVTLYLFYLWVKTKKEKYIYQAGVITGLAITTKVLALGSLCIFLILITVSTLQKKFPKKIIGKYLLIYLLFSLIIPLPWFIFSLIHTGNPVYPFFSPIYPTTISFSLLNPITFINNIWNIFMNSPDPISPIYIAILPLIMITFKKLSLHEKLITFYSILAVLIWYITPQTGGGRFILPYLPAFSLLVIITIKYVELSKQKLIIGYILVLLLISIGYRFIANAKYIPYILRKETKAQFLSKNLNFSFGDFYDTDGFFANTIKSTDNVLLFGFHNLYYVYFPFMLPGDNKSFNYIATQHTALPKQFSHWKNIYTNMKTGVNVYKKPS